MICRTAVLITGQKDGNWIVLALVLYNKCMSILDQLLEYPERRRNLSVRLAPNAEKMVKKNHPWVFEGSIIYQSHTGESGDLAVIFDKKRNFLALGLWDPYSPIRIRVLQFQKPAEINQEWFQHKIQKAIHLRAALIDQETNGYRIVHGENDGLPGLVIDRYANILVMKLYTTAWIPHLEMILACLQSLVPYESLILRMSRNIAGSSDSLHGLQDGMLLDGKNINEKILFSENGLIFEVDPIHGHKTGFYLDQRENRARVEKLAEGKSVLNVFAYSGGFSLYAARGKANAVISVDLNQHALETAIRNFSYNQNSVSIKACNHQVVNGDAFEFLESAARQHRKFDLVILDPPMFAQKKNQIDKAILNYQRLTHLGLGVLNPGGILVQASCSSRISSPVFFEAVSKAVEKSGRKMNEIERSGHAIDHPIGFPEGEYLKCLFAQIE
ncbi:MAG: class I SAM-dependent rRNA methyltransferase [Anaerolineaceae bacterium]|nr:class I SAM-dependent rRNA methyltransferase [Anaerolineaceae bacterium]